MNRKKNKFEHVYDIWPPPREKKDEEEEKKKKDSKPRNVNYIDFTKDLPPESGEEPIYEVEEKDDTQEEEQKEREEKEKEEEEDKGHER